MIILIMLVFMPWQVLDGIQQGQFLPDNVMLIRLDEYLTSDIQGNPVNDSSWRGGTIDDVNNFLCS